ncbi:hypothetical protein D6825_02350 [Candidatus Woesearchaeota archaeon]|nr:MAG: hypothetical protein D6825_02350 [Candidatus Woesearchaeota archaeon]
MNVKNRFGLLASIFALSSLSACVPGQQGGLRSIFREIGNWLKLIFLDISKGGPESVLILKLLFAFLLFVILYGIMEFLKDSLHFPRNVRLAIAAILVVISTVLVPKSILLGVAASYGIIAFSALVGVPAAGFLYAIYHFLDEPKASHRLAKAIAWLVISWVSGSFAVSRSSALEKSGVKAFSYFGGFLSTLSTIGLLIFLFYLLLALFSLGREHIDYYGKRRDIKDFFAEKPKSFFRFSKHLVEDIESAATSNNEKGLTSLLQKSRSASRSFDDVAAELKKRLGKKPSAWAHRGDVDSKVNSIMQAKADFDNAIAQLRQALLAQPVNWADVQAHATSAADAYEKALADAKDGLELLKLP